MSLLERAFSFLNCTRCGKSFGYDEKVLSCENQWNRNCFDHEAVCGKCMHDHAESIHIEDKQGYITKFVARRHDIEKKIRNFINKMETKFFNGSIGRAIDGSIGEALRRDPAQTQAQHQTMAQAVAQAQAQAHFLQAQAEPAIVRSKVAASAHEESNTEEEEEDENEEKDQEKDDNEDEKENEKEDKEKNEEKDKEENEKEEMNEEKDEEEDDDDERTYCEETKSYSGPVSYLEKVKPWIAADKARSLPDDEIREDFDDDFDDDFAEIVERRKAELLQHRSFFDQSTSGTSSGTSSGTLLLGLLAGKSIPEVVAEEPKKLDFPGIDLKTWEEEIIQKPQQEAMARLIQKRQVGAMAVLQEKLVESQAPKAEKPQETKFPGIDLKVAEETEWPIIQKRQQEAMIRLIQKRQDGAMALLEEKIVENQAAKAEKPQETKFPGIDLKVWEATEWPIIQKRQQQEAMARILEKLEKSQAERDMAMDAMAKSQAERPQETKFPGIDLKVWEETEWPIIKKRQEEEAKQQEIQEQKNDNLSGQTACPSTPNIEWPLEEEEDDKIDNAVARLLSVFSRDQADQVQTDIETPQRVHPVPIDMPKLKRGDLIMAQWDAAHDAYSVSSFGARKFFVSEESLKENRIPRYLRCFHATVQRMDLCRVRKVENRYRLPIGTEVCRIHLAPASAQSVFDGAVFQ